MQTGSLQPLNILVDLCRRLTIDQLLYLFVLRTSSSSSNIRNQPIGSIDHLKKWDEWVSTKGVLWSTNSIYWSIRFDSIRSSKVISNREREMSQLCRAMKQGSPFKKKTVYKWIDRSNDRLAMTINIYIWLKMIMSLWIDRSIEHCSLFTQIESFTCFDWSIWLIHRMPYHT